MFSRMTGSTLDAFACAAATASAVIAPSGSVADTTASSHS